jgi:Uncharacterized protein conserved in bacteria
MCEITTTSSDDNFLSRDAASMSVVNLEIIDWLKKQPAWQRNLFKRIVRGEAVDESYVDQVVRLLISGDSIDLEEPALTVDDLPQGGSKEESVIICNVRDLQGINALLGEQTLQFSRSGMTIVYGDNGSGKSGYARLLKKVSGARHQENILCNVFVKDGTTQVAKFGYRCGDTDLTAHWPSDIDYATLGRIHFYDEACGNDYLQKDTELSYRPSVLSLLDRLVNLVNNVGVAIDLHIKGEEEKRFSLPDVPEGTSAALFRAKFSDSVTLDEDIMLNELDQLLNEYPNLDEELQKYRQEEARLKASDPEKEKTRLAAIAKDAETLAKHLSSIESLLSPTAADRALELKQIARQLRVSAEEVSTDSFANEPLPGVGSTTWRAMWEAAERYAQEEAYPGHDFPAVEDDDACIFCQQPLSRVAQDRLHRFREYVQGTIQKEANDAECRYHEAIEKLRNFDVTPAAIMSSLDHFSDDGRLSKDFLISALDMAVQARHRIIECLENGGSDNWVKLTAVDLSSIYSFVSLNRSLAEGIDAVKFGDNLESVISARKGCEGIATIRNFRDRIIDEISRRSRLKKLKEIKKKTSTRSITLQSKNLATTYVTTVVSDHFFMEAQNLKLEHVILSEPKATKGAILQKPSLIGSGEAAMHVLSEGEQTAAGLAGFLTEVHFDDSKSAVIFDDPMSSLDHRRRSNAAKRIVEVAQDRQVIVFTHDLVFLAELIKFASYLGVSVSEQTIQRNGAGRPGLVTQKFPWKAKDAKARIEALENDLNSMGKVRGTLSSDDYERRTSDWAGRLSETWERLIRTEVIYRVVDRSTTEVRPMLVRILAKITEDDYRDFDAGYSAASKWARRHDKSEEVSYVVPEFDEMRVELDRIKEWHRRIKKYAA